MKARLRAEIKEKLQNEPKTAECFCFKCERMFYWVLINDTEELKLKCPSCRKKVKKGDDVYLT